MANTSYFDLYKALKADGAVQGDWNSFHKFVGAQGKQGYLNRKKLYDALKADGAVQASTYEEFNNTLFRGGQASLKAAQQRNAQSNTRTQAHARYNNGGNAATQKPQTAAQRALQMLQQPTAQDEQPQQVDYLSRPQEQMPKYGKDPREKVSPFVQALYSEDNARRSSVERPYTMPTGKKEDSSFVQNMKQRDQRQKQFMRGAASVDGQLADYEKQQNAPVVDNGTVGVMKTQGQLMDELNASAQQFVDNNMGSYIDQAVSQEFDDSHKRGLQALGNDYFTHGTGGADWFVGEKKYQQQLDPDTMIKSLSGKVGAMVQSPDFIKQVESEASRLGVDPTEYAQNSVAPKLMDKISSKLMNEDVMRRMPKGTLEYIAGGILNSMTGALLTGLTTSKQQRQNQQQADAMTREGNNPNYQPGTWSNAARGTVSFLADAPAFGAAGKVGAKIAGKAFGEGQALAARLANMSKAERIITMGAQGATSGGVTGFLYGAVNAPVQNLSTGEDTSLGNTLMLALQGGMSEAASFALMSGLGGAVGGFGHGIGINGMEASRGELLKHGAQKLGFEGVKVITEGLGMWGGGNLARAIEGEKQDWSIAGGLESVASAAIFKLMHAKEVGKRDPQSNGFWNSVSTNIKRYFISDNAKTQGFALTNDEKDELANAGVWKGKNEPITVWANRIGRSKNVDADTQDVATTYDAIMKDPSVSWDAKAKFSTLVMGVVPSSRPQHDHYGFSIETVNGKTNKYVSSFAKDGTLLSKASYDKAGQRDSIIYENAVNSENIKLKNAYALAVGAASDERMMQSRFLLDSGYKQADPHTQEQMRADMENKGSDLYRNFLNWCAKQADTPIGRAVAKVSEATGMSAEGIMKAFNKDPMKRSDAEQNVSVIFRKALTSEVFPESKPHPEQSSEDGKDVVTDNNLGTEQPNGEAVVTELRNLKQAEAEMAQLMNENDIFSDNFKVLQQHGLTHPQIYDWMIQNGMTEEQLLPYAKYMNQVAKVQGMQDATATAIEENVGAFVQDWTFHGTMDGDMMNGEQALWVKDNTGRTLLVGSGDVAYDPTNGKPKEGVGDMLVCLDPNTGEIVYIKVEDTTLLQNQSAADLEAYRRQQLQQVNSAPYNQAAQEQAMVDAASPQPKEEAKPKETVTNGNGLEQPQQNNQMATEQPIQQEGSQAKENNAPIEENSLTFKDGSPVPVDANGEPDFMQMSPEQGAELYTDSFNDPDAQVAKDVKAAEKALKDAQKMEPKGKTFNEKKRSQQVINETIKAAEEQLRVVRDIQKSMTAQKVAETVGKPEGETVQDTEGMDEATKNFVEAPKVEGRKGTITLPNGEEISGTYYAVPAMSLIPSHDPFNGYKPHAGVPLDENGHTINDRDYYSDKGAQDTTNAAGNDYDGRAISDVPVVNPDGRVLSGNGRTMAGQLAAANGKDAKYAESRDKNAAGFGMKAEALNKLDHARIIFVPDEPLPYTTDTFAKFNRNEKKTQSNTEQAVAKAKLLSPDDVGAIIADIEGNGSLEAFFNNPNAINSLIKTLQEKGIIGQNEVAELMEGTDKLSPQGKEKVKNLLLGSIFKPETIRMLGVDSAIKNKAIAGIRAVMDNLKLGYYSLRDEIDSAIQLLYEARTGGDKVDTLLRTPEMFGESAAERYPSISQMMALALEGKASDFRDLLNEYNREASARNTGEGDMYGDVPTKEELIRDFLNYKKWKDYDTRGNSEAEGGNDAEGIRETEPEAQGGNGERNDEWYNQSAAKLATAKGEERKKILHGMGEYVKDYAKKNGFDEPVVYDTWDEIEKDMPGVKEEMARNSDGETYFGGFSDGKKMYFVMEDKGVADINDVKDTFNHEATHIDNTTDPSRKEAIIASVKDFKTVKLTDLLNAIEYISNTKEYTKMVNEMIAHGEDPTELLAEEFLANAVEEIYRKGEDAVSEITSNPTLQKLALDAYKFRENDRRGKEGHGAGGVSTTGEVQVRKASDSKETVRTNVQANESKQEPQQKGGDGHGRENVEGRGVKPDEKEPSTNPVKTIEESADAYRQEKIDKAAEAYKKAKESDDEEQTTKAAKTLKHLMDENLKGKGYSLRQRQAAIALQVGKKEAETIDKPLDEMDSEELEFVASKNPLTESEIRELAPAEDKNFIEDAVDYVNGNHGFAQKLAYLKIYKDVRNRHENAPDNSGAKDGTQLAPADNGSGEGLGLGTGRDSGGSAGQLDRGTGEEPAPRERGSGESGENDPHIPAGEQGDKQGEGAASRVGDVPARGAESEGGSGPSGNGNVPERGGQDGGGRPAAKNAERKPTAKQGTTWRGRSGEEIKKNVEDKKAAALAAIAQLKKLKYGKGGSGNLGSMELMTPEQMEYLPTVANAIKDYGMAIIDQGIYKVKDWLSNVRDTFMDALKDSGFTETEVDRFIKEMWNSKMTMDGETHTIEDWCSIYGQSQLRKKLNETLDEKRQRQMDAEPIKVKVGDRKNIEETLPYLLPEQQEDVYRAETQFFGKEHADREHAYGKGYMFTNGTGTGKTYTGLGIAKRLVKQGKKRILFVTPSDKKVKDWIKDGKNLGLDIRSLDDWAKERGTTATTENGDGCVITTFANFGVNKKLLEAEWDAVIYDESHRIMENKKGTETSRSMQHYKVSNRDENHCFLRLQDINPHYQKMQNAADKFAAQREKERKNIIKEYKKAHPAATTKEIINATYKMMPKDINGFAPADGQTFPKLGKLYNDFKEAQAYYNNKVKPSLEKQAKGTWKNTKTIFLSATPFNTRENLDYAEGYIFKYPESEESGMSGRTRFYLDHFGAAYKFRYNRLEQSISNPEAVAKQEVAFSDYLQNNLGTMSGRIIDSPYDYSRDFPTVAPDHADAFNDAVQGCLHTKHLYSAYLKTIGDYNYGSALFETMKVANSINRIKEHLAAGRKVVIYHRRVETKEPIRPPFEYMLDVANQMIAQMKDGKEKEEFIAEANEFREKHQDLLQWEKGLDYSMPREQIAKVFGKDNVLFFSGKESKKVKDAAVDTFNSDGSGKNILVIQEASGKEGISLHDTTGEHQRVVITLALPQSPITALQIEGRIYRIGNMSNAIFEYPILGLNSEMMLFGQKFNNQVSTTENLALGSQARNLRDSFAKGILEHSGIVPIDQQGVGGKAFDAPKEQGDSDPFDDAVLDYYSNQKLNKNNRDGVDYFPTPEPLGYKMVQWAGLQEGDSVLEPSAGHGAIARYVPQSNDLVNIEPSQNLFSRLQLKVGGFGRKFLNNTFENYDIHNKHDAIIMNPPFGKAGALAMQHIDKAFKHLDEGGRIVALIPRGITDKKFDAWLGQNKDAVMRAEVNLPDITFQQAGTSVMSRVVILDKVSKMDMREKAGSPEKIDLSGRYDKIEDFFEDLRNIEMPDRIIDTNFKVQKKSRQTVKDLNDIKGVRKVDMDKNGINVKLKGNWMEYAFSFVGSEKPDFFKKKMASYYQQYKEFEKDTWRDEEKAVFNEFQKLACKLAGMTEEEMQRYIKTGEGNGTTHFREDRGIQYSKTDEKDVKNSRIIPEDVDKSVSSQIEKKFDDEIASVYGRDLTPEEKSEVERIANIYRNTPIHDEYSKDENGDKQNHGGLESAIKTWERVATEFENYYGIERITRTKADGQDNELDRGTSALRREARNARMGGRVGEIPAGDFREYQRYLTNLASAKRALAYHNERTRVLEGKYGVKRDEWLSQDTIEKIFKDFNADKNLQTLFDRIKEQVNNLDVYFGEVYGSEKGLKGFYRHSYNDIRINLDELSTFGKTKQDLASTILHEMLHPVTSDIIAMYQEGRTDKLTPSQIEAAKEAVDLFNEIKKTFKDNGWDEPYALTNAREFFTELSNPEWRAALKEIKNGDSWWKRALKSLAKMIGFKTSTNKLDEAEKVLDNLLSNFGKEQFDYAARHANKLFKDKQFYKVEDKDELDRLSKEDRELFDSLNIKRNTRKDYNDTVTELARRLAGEDGGTEENVSSRHTDGGRAQMGRSDERFVSRPNGINLCAAKVIAHDVIRRSSTKGLSESKERLGLGQEGYVENSSDVENGKVPQKEFQQEGVASPVERDISSRIENWAKQNNAWFDWRNLRGRFDRDSRLGTGDEAESDVYLSKDGKSVLKIVRNPHAIYDSLLEKINSIELHNELFPDNAINIIGFTKVNEEGFSTTSLLLEQPYVDGKTLYDSFETQKEKDNFRKEFMTSQGFTRERWSSTSGFFEGIPDDIWKKGGYAVEDVNAGNIIIDKDGKPHIIDCVVRKYKDAIKDKAIYDSTEEKKQIKEQNRFKVNKLESSLENEQKKLAVFAEARNERNKEVVDRVLKEAKEKIKVLKKQIKELESSGTHFREDSVARISDDAPVVVKHVDKIAKQVGGKVKMIQSVDEITNKSAKEAIEAGRNINGWYDEKTGEVHLYMPNIHDRYTAEKTIWHEVVGHKGMRELFGDENYSKFLRSIWYDLDKPENARLKELVSEELKYNPFDFENGIEEGIARLVEDGKGEPGFWNAIKNKVTDILHEIGYRIAPNTKDVKYLLWLGKNLQKNPNDPYWKMKAEAVRYKLDKENVPAMIEKDGVFYTNDGKARSFNDLTKKEFDEATDGVIHLRTTPSAGTALDRYHKALDAHGYMFTESYMDNMLSLKNLMQAIVPDNKNIADIKSSENPYILQNTMQGAMSNAAQMFERNVMKPLDKAMAEVLDAFDGKKDKDKIKNFNLYMITKHGLERNRILYMRDTLADMRKDEKNNKDVDVLEKDWYDELANLDERLNRGAIDLKGYFDGIDDFIRTEVDDKFDAGKHDYSGIHAIQGIEKSSDPYDDAEAIASVMDAEANMESIKKGSVKAYWDKVKAATQYAIDTDYKNGLISRELHGYVSGMFNWYVPLRKYDEATAEDTYGYITEKGDPKNFIGSSIMRARGHKYLSETNVLAQIGAMGNRAINNGGQNAIKQAFARFIRNHSDNNLVTETSVWYVDDPVTKTTKERYPEIPEDATPDEVNQIVADFNSEMRDLESKGLATKVRRRGRIGYKFERAENKSQHIVDVMIAGKKHSFIINGNPRAAQALNGLLEHKNTTFLGKAAATISRFMAQTCTSYNPEFVMRNMVRDFEFASSNLLAKEGFRYTTTFEKYYAQVGLIEGIRNTKLKDFKDTGGFGLFAKYRNGTLDMNDKIQKYFKEFMENGGETGWVQVKNMKDLTKEYKSHIKAERNGVVKVGKGIYDAIFKNLENANEIAENMARFATYCASRDYGRTIVRSTYDAKEVSTNFNRHGSGGEIKSFKNGEMGSFKEGRKNFYGFSSSYLRNCSMFFNAGIQSTNLLVKNLKTNPVSTGAYIMAAPFMSGALMALVNNMIIAGEDEKDRNGVKDPYGELPDYIRKNNLCIYIGGGEFITIPLAIEERAFYGLGDLAAGMTFSPNIKTTRSWYAEGIGCASQLVPVLDYLGNKTVDKDPVAETLKATLPSATSPFVEWAFNSDWKGAPIERENSFDKNQPAWMRAYHGTPEVLIDINKKVNAMTNDVAKGNEDMLGNRFLDAVTNPSAIQHFYSGYLGGAATFVERSLGLIKHGKDTETKDIPFVRSLLYTPSEQTSLQRTKSKWYNYVDEMETTMANVDRLKAKNVPIDKRLTNIADYYHFQNSSDAAKVRIIELAQKQMKQWKKMRDRATDTQSVNFANQNIDRIMMEAVDELDRME